MEKCKEEMVNGNTAFIWSIQITPEPIVFMATKRQLVEVERFCCNPANFCVLGIDATFELCNYYLTFATDETGESVVGCRRVFAKLR